MRADATRNRERLLDVTVELILDVGGEPSRSSIAERAGVGIGTLYRHFPDQQSLLHAVTRHVLERTIAAGEGCLADSDDSFDALRRYSHAAIDNGTGVVNIIYGLLASTDWPDLRTRAESVLDAIVKRCKRDGVVPEDFSVSDISYATIRYGRPLGTGLTASEERAIAHRHLDFYLGGLHRS